jgi:hypothetical protein
MIACPSPRPVLSTPSRRIAAPAVGEPAGSSRRGVFRIPLGLVCIRFSMCTFGCGFVFPEPIVREERGARKQSKSVVNGGATVFSENYQKQEFPPLFSSSRIGEKRNPDQTGAIHLQITRLTSPFQSSRRPSVCQRVREDQTTLHHVLSVGAVFESRGRNRPDMNVHRPDGIFNGYGRKP